MGSRISVVDLRAAWVNYVSAARNAGFDTDGWHMQEGSASTGVHYSARTKGGTGVPGTSSTGFNSAYLGTTRSEAYQALQHMMAAMKAVIMLRNGEWKND